MFQITQRAIGHLEQLRRQKGLDSGTGVRFVRSGGRVGLTFTRAPEEGDRVVPRSGLALYLAPSVVEAFDHSVIDATAAEDRMRLVVRPQRSARSGRPH